MGRFLQSVLLAVLVGVLCPGLEAQSESAEWWPEADVYLQLTDRLRASVIAARSQDRESRNATSLEVGPNLDVTLKSFRQMKAKDSLDSSKHTYLTFRAGYHHLFNTGGSDEDRVILEVTPRFYLPKSILVSDRHRADLRFIAGTFSWRYRNRLSVERGFRIKSLRLTPYLRGEIYRDSRFGVWNRHALGGGIVFPVRKRLEIEPYFERDSDSRSSPAHINAAGITVSVYFDRRRRKP